MARMEAMTMKMDVQYKELQSHSKQPNPDHNDDDTPMSREEEAKFMQTFRSHPNLTNHRKLEMSRFCILEMEEDSKVPLILERPFLHTANAVIQVKQKQLNLRVGTERITFHMDSAMKHSYFSDDTCFSIDVIDEILEEDFDAFLDEGIKILYSIEGTILKEKLFARFNEYVAMIADENCKSESDTEESPFEKITFNIDYKIKTCLEEPPMDVKLKLLLDNSEYTFMEEPFFLPVIISSRLSKENKNKPIFVLKRHRQAFAWKTTDVLGICASFCKHKISTSGRQKASC
uniref:Reverse transcriptase domain-containing protein n=1 Tax=Tanacetum cinerariifolium TaxID=118510 RepID=A0A699I3Q1_TANCI|nr:reverse transcriptase domain-containing protein [Tanacetum cinerariifolium]